MCSCQGLVVKYQMISRKELDKRMRPGGASYRQEQLISGGGRTAAGLPPPRQPPTTPKTRCHLSGDRNYHDEHTSRFTDDLFSTERLAETLFHLADADGDQTVTKEELTSAITQHPELCELWPEFKMEGDELFRLIGRGMLSKEIGDTIGITPLTVQSHRKNIAQKLGTTGNQLTQQALRHYHATLGAKD